MYRGSSNPTSSKKMPKMLSDIGFASAAISMVDTVGVLEERGRRWRKPALHGPSKASSKENDTAAAAAMSTSDQVFRFGVAKQGVPAAHQRQQALYGCWK